MSQEKIFKITCVDEAEVCISLSLSNHIAMDDSEDDESSLSDCEEAPLISMDGSAASASQRSKV